MRLAQLSRKIQVKPGEILQYITTQFNAEIIPSPNSKIPEEYLDHILANFQKNKQSVGEQNTAVDTTAPSVDNSSETVTSNQEAITPSETNTETQLNIQDGVIRAPKIEVEGVKVIGKIDLPEPKQAETPVEEEATSQPIDSQDEASTSESRKTAPKKRKTSRKQRKKKNAPSYQEQQIKEQEAYQRSLEKKRAQEKARKEAHYQQKMQANQQAKATKKKNKKKLTAREKQIQLAKEKEAAPKTLWQKFIYWLND